ncbi:hypothetical protein KY346_06365 [Candidatus Woesearchaeota archaeon]|nr:hypothetical protein [Candidatus Woesearchaeota archaeon]
MARYHDENIEDRINDGEDITKFWPNQEDGGDAHTALLQSQLRRNIYFGEENHTGFKLAEISGPKQSKHRYALIDTSRQPDNVLSHIPGWEYDSEIGPGKRAFKYGEQGLQLDVEETLRYLSATEREDVQAALEREIENIDNEVILQRMFLNLEAGRTPFFPNLYMDVTPKRSDED